MHKSSLYFKRFRYKQYAFNVSANVRWKLAHIVRQTILSDVNDYDGT